MGFNITLPDDCADCGASDKCHHSCICPSCTTLDAFSTIAAYEAWAALAPAIRAFQFLRINWGFSHDEIRDQFLIEIVDADTVIEVTHAGKVLTVTQFDPVDFSVGSEEIIYTGEDLPKAVDAAVKALTAAQSQSQ